MQLATESLLGVIDRPIEYDKEIADIICSEIAVGMTLSTLCSINMRVPTEWHVYEWLKNNEEFRKEYARARSLQQDHYADGIIDIADDETIEADSRRVKIEARKWVASKLAPKKYGDKQQIDVNQTLSLSSLVDQAMMLTDVTPIVKALEHQSESQLQESSESIDDYL